MTKMTPFRLSRTRVLLLAALFALLCAIPAFAQAPTVSAQINCGTYISYSGTCNGGTGQISCGTYISYSGTCNGGVGQISCGTYISYSGTCNGGVGQISCGTYISYSGTCNGGTGQISCGTYISYSGTCNGTAGQINCGSYISYSGTCTGTTGQINCGSYISYSGTCNGSTGQINCGTYVSYSGTCSSNCGASTSVAVYNGGCGQYGQYGTGATCPTTLAAGQSCSNGVITCQGTAAPTTAGAPCTGAVGGGIGSGPYCAQTKTYVPAATCLGTAAATTTTTTTTPAITVAGTTTAATTTAATTAASTTPAASTLLVTCPGTGATVTNLSQCPQTCSNGQVLPPGQTCPGGSTSTSATTSTTAGSSTATCAGTAIPAAASTAGGTSVNYTTGWNLIAGPTGTVVNGASGSLYTFQAGDSAYETVAANSPLKGGVGYWACFSSAVSSSIPAGTPGGTITVNLPAGQFVMIGNPGTTVAAVSGADTVLTYSTAAGYTQTTALPVGAGAWVMSNSGGVVTITNASS
jgi:hypothetical protein